MLNISDTSDKYEAFLVAQPDVESYTMERLLHYVVFDSTVTTQQYAALTEVFKEDLLTQSMLSFFY